MSEPTVIEQLKSAKEQIAAMTSELSTAKAELAKATESAAALSAEKAAIEAAAAKAKSEAEAVATEQAAKIKAESDARASAESAKAETEKQLATAQAALKNPAFAHAAIHGMKPVADSGAEQKADLWPEFQAITDPTARAEFWQKHAGQLKLTAKNRSN